MAREDAVVALLYPVMKPHHQIFKGFFAGVEAFCFGKAVYGQRLGVEVRSLPYATFPIELVLGVFKINGPNTQE